MRPGSETNRGKFQELGVAFFHGDIRTASGFESLPTVD
jgi:CDP-paratose 2-epimerase